MKSAIKFVSKSIKKILFLPFDFLIELLDPKGSHLLLNDNDVTFHLGCANFDRWKYQVQVCKTAYYVGERGMINLQKMQIAPISLCSSAR